MEVLEQELLDESGQTEIDDYGQKTLFVRGIDQAEALRSRARFWQLRNDDVRVVVQGMTDTEANTWSKKLTDDWKACGCEIGGLLTVVALIGCGLHLWSLNKIDIGEISIAVGIVFASALIGKIVGLIFAYTRLRYRLRELGRRIEGLRVRIEGGRA